MLKQNCEFCMNYIYDEEYGENICDVDMDMDEAERIIHGSYKQCPYFRINNESKIVEKQN